MESSCIEQKLINPGLNRSENISDLFKKAVDNFKHNAIIDIDYSKSMYLVLGLLNEDEEKMRIYFLSKEKYLLTADERTHCTLLNKKVLNRVCELADFGKDNVEEFKACDEQQYEAGILDDEEESLFYLSWLSQQGIQIKPSGCIFRRRKMNGNVHIGAQACFS